MGWLRRFNLLARDRHDIADAEVVVEELEERRRLRLLFMNTVYEKTRGDRFTFTNLAEIAPALNLNTEEAGVIGEYLVGEGLIKWATFGGGIAITHHGIKVVEEALNQPNLPSYYFPAAITVLHVGQNTGQIQVGTSGSTQHQIQGIGDDDQAELARFVQETKRARERLGVDANAGAELDAQLATIDAQMKSPRPQRAVLKGAGEVLVEILKSASGSAAAELIKQLPSILR
jgi:predicted transcriptional regulator